MNPEASSWNDWISVNFSSDNIVNGAIQLNRSSTNPSTKNPGGDQYTLQFYLKKDDGTEAWANLKTTK
jgi:hypothetical protein